MANERKTENIVRNHFLKYSDNIIIEEQKSDNIKIDKLLKTASKGGLGKGYPEFLIQYNSNSNSNFLIVIECKADIRKHESEHRNNYSEYSVDGVLLYASYLSKEYDVLAIAISGETTDELKISHFLHLKGEKSPINIFGDTLLSPDNYIEGYSKCPEKFRQDYKALLNYTKELNDYLHTHKILENQRSLLISCILIALENKAFKKSYDSHNNARDLANFLVQTVSNELENANIGRDKLDNLYIQFSFIKTDTSLSGKNNVLKDLISDIDSNINQFIKNHEYFDVLGQLYIEFLRYANSDKGLGIVLTPPHITELFSELAQVNKNSIILDNCTGTGGFLISAMKKMIENANGDNNKIKEIKTNQLIGIEYQAHIFALAVSNMYIHQDGKTNIINGSCFDKTIIQSIKQKKPTIGFLNPPYKSDKKNDTDELEFILNNLECLIEGGTCIAIVPMQSAIAQKGKVFEYKKKLLEKHTLEAVLSMPDELFFNSKVSVVSCIMIFTAHKPHPNSKETYFGYYKDDGFIKRKIQGRFDAFGKWNDIKEKWIEYYINKKTEPGFSVKKTVSAKDEWCAEAYMSTNYNLLTEKNFENTLLQYCSFLFSNKLRNNVSIDSINRNISQLNVEKWKSFKIDEIFSIKGSKTTSIIELEEYGKGIYPYVTTQASNNGTESFYNFFTEDKNVLTIDSAVIGYCSYQPEKFSASDHVEKLIPKFKMNKYIALFLVTILNLENYRYNYGRKASQSRMKNTYIKLPVDNNNNPDYDFMENYIKSLKYSGSI
jgi:N-6 DNA Methylase family protein